MGRSEHSAALECPTLPGTTRGFRAGRGTQGYCLFALAER
jgi:hypothetical protein